MSQINQTAASPSGKRVLQAKSAKRAQPCLAQSKNKPRIGFRPVRGLSFLTLPELPSGTREFPAPAARKEQLSNGQYQQQRTQKRAARRLGRCAARVALCFE